MLCAMIDWRHNWEGNWHSWAKKQLKISSAVAVNSVCQRCVLSSTACVVQICEMLLFVMVGYFSAKYHHPHHWTLVDCCLPRVSLLKWLVGAALSTVYWRDNSLTRWPTSLIARRAIGQYSEQQPTQTSALTGDDKCTVCSSWFAMINSCQWKMLKKMPTNEEVAIGNRQHYYYYYD